MIPFYIVLGVAKSQTQLSDFHFHVENLERQKGLKFTSPFAGYMEKEMATHSSVLAWRIPGTGKPGELPSMGSHRVRHD